jgi:hypothetical protein
MAGAEVGCGGPDALAGDELDSGGRGGPAVEVQSHAQQRAQRSAGQADLDPARARGMIVLDRPVQQTVTEPEFVFLPGALQRVKRGQACLERDVHDPPE